MTDENFYKIPIKPISINKCWQGRRYKTQEYNKWRKSFVSLANNLPRYDKWVSIEVEAYIKFFVRSDVDNMLKPLLDALQDAGIIKDDKYVLSLKITKKRSREDYFLLKIEDIKETT